MRNVFFWVGAIGLGAGAVSGQDAEFERDLMKKESATLRDAVAMISWIAHEGLEPISAEKAVEEAFAKGTLPESWREELGEGVNYGQVAYLICASQKISGGLSMRIFGYTKRYCYRECVYLELMDPKGAHTRLRGVELIDVANRLEAWIEEREEGGK